jgi:hypothetical protein
MLFVLVGIVLAIGWYLYSAERTSDHLVKRNFNYLNQVASNINAIVDAAAEAVPFNSGNVQACIRKEFGVLLKTASVPINPANDSVIKQRIDRASQLRVATETCLEKTRSRLINQGALVDDPAAIELTYAPQNGYGPFDVVDSKYLCADVSGKPGQPFLVSRIQQSMVNIVPDGILNMYYMYSALAESQRLADMPMKDEDGRVVGTEKMVTSIPVSMQCGDRVGREVPSHSGVLLANMTMKIPFEKVRGVLSTESFFDALLIANSNGNDSSVLFSNTELPIKIDEHAIAALFRARSGFERFSSISEFEIQNGRLHGPLGPDGKPGGDGTRQMPFTQSALVPIVIGGFSHLAFVQPVRSQHTNQPDLVLVGIVGQGSFNKLKYAVPYNWLSNALMLLVVGILSLNFFRLKLLRDRGVIHRSDTLLGCISLMGIASLVVVFLVHVAGSREFNAVFDRDLRTLAQWISEEFQRELDEKVAVVYAGGKSMTSAAPPNLLPLSKGMPTLKGECEQSVAPTTELNRKYPCKPISVPPVSTLFVLDETGRQAAGYATHSPVSSELGFSVAGRNYYREIVNGGGWAWSGAADSGTTGPRRIFLQRIESKAAGSMETAISMPHSWSQCGKFKECAAQSQDQSTTINGVMVGLAKFQSLEEVVLPPGFGFAVFDRATGTVLFHSNHKRNLRENIYRATDDDTALKAAIVAGVRMDLDLNYKGEKVDAVVEPLENTRWNILVYHQNSIVDIVNFHFGISALILAALYGALWLIGVPALVWLVLWVCRLAFVESLRRRGYTALPPQFLYPVAELLPRYRRLALLQTVFALAYIGVINLFDFPFALLLVLLPMLLAPTLWYLLLQGDATELKSIGSMTSAQFASAQTADRRQSRRRELVQTYAWYRFNAVLLILGVAVLPTMLLHNENYDVHEKLWLEFSNWSLVDRMEARSHAYRDYMSRLNPVTESPVSSDGKLSAEKGLAPALERRQWRGVYLPRTDVYRIEGNASACTDAGISDLEPRILLPRYPVRTEGRSRLDYEVDTQYIQVLTPGSRQLPGCNMVYGKDGKLIVHRARSGEQDQQSRFISSLVGILPNVGDDGSLLESFISADEPRTGTKNAANTVKEEGDDPLAESRLLTAGTHVDSEFAYSIYNFFPHTRPTNNWVMVITYFVLAVVSGIVISMLHGFLMRSFLSRDFEAALPDIARNFTLEDFHDGGIVVCPAGLNAETAFNQFIGDMGISRDEYSDEGENVELWGAGDVALVEGRKLLIVKAFYAVIKDRRASARVMELIRRKRKEGYCTVILSDIDLDHWIYHRMHAADMPQQEFHRWEGLITSLPTFMLPRWRTASNGSREMDKTSYQLSRRGYRRTWNHCSEDERMVLLGLHYEGVVNPRNEYTLRALYRRRLIEFRNGHFEYGDSGWYEFVGGQMHRSMFHSVAQRYKNDVWRAFRAPMLLLLLVLVLFIAYVAQDEMKIAFSLLGTVGGGAAALSTLGSRLRELRGLTGK